MKWTEKLSLVSLCLVLISWGWEISDNWPLLVAHITRSTWIILVLVPVGVFLMLAGAYAKAPKGTPARLQIVLATVLVIISWSADLSLIGKVGCH
jgi:hypothetical protein